MIPLSLVFLFATTAKKFNSFFFYPDHICLIQFEGIFSI